jgi:TM2 domain-containing membrane protein YozV
MFGGFLGLDRFYLGYIGIGFLKLFTGGLFSVLCVMDIVKITKGTMRDKRGNSLK